MTTPKFKIGDRVKWKDVNGQDRVDDIYIYDSKTQDYYLTKNILTPGAWRHESHLSLVEPEPAANSGLSNKLTELVIALINSNLSINHRVRAIDAVINPKQFATNREAELGAEIINLHGQIADQKKEIHWVNMENERLARDVQKNSDAAVFAMLRGETEVCATERAAKEAARKELAEANDKIKRLKSLIGEL